MQQQPVKPIRLVNVPQTATESYSQEKPPAAKYSVKHEFKAAVQYTGDGI
ncbi:hypothetical protein GCM10010982_14760 [Bowmanella pacifica]|uniref:Uncharacterized protein n=1 Tax=Bowmanella pacifica TaxID=502051 RepID=A0A918DHQ6_9ALTE|nr:hypothetical protein GCM10010982_14760 [Bowmanella pacifica]